MLKVYNPFDLSELESYEFHTKKDLEEVLSTAYALNENPNKRLSKSTRIEVLSSLVGLMKSEHSNLVQIALREGGKPYTDTVVEVNRAIEGVELAIKHIKDMVGDMVPMGHTTASDNKTAYTIKQPIGVVAAISAFNHPLNLAVHQMITAVAAGCPVIMKPALTTPMSTLRLHELLIQAGLPEGYAQVLLLEDELSKQLATDPRVAYLTFIGSAKVGWYLRSKIAPGTRIALEHGGVAPVIVHEDTNIDALIPGLVKGAFYHAGQVCVSVQRVYVHENVMESFKASLIEHSKKLKVGDPAEEGTEVGPIILPKELDRIEEWVSEAKEEGAEVLLGGNRIGETCYAPTIILNPSEDSKVSREEVFGPVVCLYSYSDLDDAIKRANALPFSFQAAIYSKNMDVVHQATTGLKAAAVMVNNHTAFRVDWMPFGGQQHSGIGVGGIQYTMEEMSAEKLLVIQH